MQIKNGPLRLRSDHGSLFTKAAGWALQSLSAGELVGVLYELHRDSLPQEKRTMV